MYFGEILIQFPLLFPSYGVKQWPEKSFFQNIMMSNDVGKTFDLLDIKCHYFIILICKKLVLHFVIFGV